jgi:hypothetical protein
VGSCWSEQVTSPSSRAAPAAEAVPDPPGVPARKAHNARQRHLRFPATWPWATNILNALCGGHGVGSVDGSGVPLDLGSR